jgi:hypothetical protein
MPFVVVWNVPLWRMGMTNSLLLFTGYLLIPFVVYLSVKLGVFAFYSGTAAAREYLKENE